MKQKVFGLKYIITYFMFIMVFVGFAASCSKGHYRNLYPNSVVTLEQKNALNESKLVLIKGKGTPGKTLQLALGDPNLDLSNLFKEKGPNAERIIRLTFPIADKEGDPYYWLLKEKGPIGEKLIRLALSNSSVAITNNENDPYDLEIRYKFKIEYGSFLEDRALVPPIPIDDISSILARLRQTGCRDVKFSYKVWLSHRSLGTLFFDEAQGSNDYPLRIKCEYVNGILVGAQTAVTRKAFDKMRQDFDSTWGPIFTQIGSKK